MDWNYFCSGIIGAIVGGVFTLMGGYFQVYLSSKRRKEENIKQMKTDVLEKLTANRPALSTSDSNQIYKKDFFNSLNQISLTFNDNKKVIQTLEKFWRGVENNSKKQELNELFYDLIKEMYDDLNLNTPSFEVFSRFFH